MCQQASTSVLCSVCLGDCEDCIQREFMHPPENIKELAHFVGANSLTALGRYEWPINALIHLIKFKHRPAFCTLLSQWFMKYPLQECIYPDALVALPASPFKQLVRGYNTPTLITQQLCDELRIADLPSALTTENRWWSQHKHNREQRLAQHLSFRCNPLPEDCQRIALIDDIITTGATLKAAIQSIKANNPYIEIDVWVMGVTPPPSVD